MFLNIHLGVRTLVSSRCGLKESKISMNIAEILLRVRASINRMS